MGCQRKALPPCLQAASACGAGAQAFKSYDEAGAVRRIQCLKYLVLATMLMESAVDPFDAQARLFLSHLFLGVWQRQRSSAALTDAWQATPLKLGLHVQPGAAA